MAILEFYTRDHEYCSPEYKMPDVFGVYPVHILVYRGHSDPYLWQCLFNYMDSYDDFNVTSNGITPMDLAEGKPNIQMRLLDYQIMLKGRHFYRLGQTQVIHYQIINDKFKKLRQSGLSKVLLPQLTSNSIHSPLYPNSLPFFTPLYVAVLADDLPFLRQSY